MQRRLEGGGEDIVRMERMSWEDVRDILVLQTSLQIANRRLPVIDITEP